MPEVALVFVTTNEGKVLMDALRSLMDPPPTSDLEVVVVDNASSDGVGRSIAAEWPWVRVIRREEMHGLPSNLNLGIRSTTAPCVMLCNSDLIFKPGSIDILVDFMRTHPRAGMVAPRLLDQDGQPRPSARRWYTVTSLFLLKGPWRHRAAGSRSIKLSLYEDWDAIQPKLVDWVPCPATLVRRAAMDDVGLMDERFRLYFDDVDISLRMHQGGWEVWCVPDAHVIHLEQRASVSPFSRAWRWHLISLAKFVWKHKGLRPRSS